MQSLIRKFVYATAAVTLSVVLAPTSKAQCGGLKVPVVRPAALSGMWQTPHLLRAGFLTEDRDRDWPEPVVGFWHEKFILSTPGGPVTIDAGYSQWHSDGTEILNSGAHAPITSSFCLGVWERVGQRTYKLNHFAEVWNPAATSPENPYGVLLGPARIQEEVTVGPDGEHFTGTFTIDQFDENGVNLAHVAGTVTATRIKVNTPEESIF